MILVLGGTTEGRKAAEVLEEAGTPYFYSTKTGEQDIKLHHGTVISGALDREAMRAFCQEHEIRLVIDAAHPFAVQLHHTIATVCAALHVPVIRYERIYPPRDKDITWIDDYAHVPTDLHSLLATTGVQSIGKLKWLEKEGVKVTYRILNRESSIQLAHQQGATDEQLCFYEENDMPDAEAILLKESGLSGGFTEKTEAARKKGMRIIAIKRPTETIYEGDSVTVNGQCSMFNVPLGPMGRLRSITEQECSTVNGPYGLRRAVEKLLPEFYPLHSGLTTGTCATAAAVAATIRLLEGRMPNEVPVLLPDGETIHVAVAYGADYASVIKDSGDDPDVTNGIEIRASVEPSDTFQIIGGMGVGTFTLPGFDFPPGEAAINKAPREMLRANIKENVRVTISVPDGEEIARRTFNPRLGIEGGISIIGVSGIVKPFSEQAFIHSIRKCMEVAKASGTDRVVINSGFKSERYLKALYPDRPTQAFVQYGNYIGETLKIANELNIANVTLGVMLGKAVKLAQGHLDTHNRKTVMDKGFIAEMLDEADCHINIDDITLARELWERLPAEKLSPFSRVVIAHCYAHCAPLLEHGKLTILLIDDNGTIY